MPRYFFDVNDGCEIRDDRGRNLSDTDAARAHANRMMSRYMRDTDQLVAEGGTVAVDARDADGNHVFTTRMVLSVEVR